MSTLILVAAMTPERVIGSNNRLPWRLPADLAYFKAVTIGKPIVMGRRTFESIGKPLPKRENWVISSNLHEAPEGTKLASSLDEAITSLCHEPEIMIIGGGQLYTVALPLADKMLLTIVEADIAGDTYFPAWSEADWTLSDETLREADRENPHRLRFQIWERTRAKL